MGSGLSCRFIASHSFGHLQMVGKTCYLEVIRQSDVAWCWSKVSTEDQQVKAWSDQQNDKQISTIVCRVNT